jgi:hypothetical protein
MSPALQRWVALYGVAAVAPVVCYVSAGTACLVAGLAAGAIVAWLAVNHNPRCWVEFKISYTGKVKNVNPEWRC